MQKGKIQTGEKYLTNRKKIINSEKIKDKAE